MELLRRDLFFNHGLHRLHRSVSVRRTTPRSSLRPPMARLRSENFEVVVFQLAGKMGLATAEKKHHRIFRFYIVCSYC